jgi:hypothetical protein
MENFTSFVTTHVHVQTLLIIEGAINRNANYFSSGWNAIVVSEQSKNETKCHIRLHQKVNDEHTRMFNEIIFSKCWNIKNVKRR